MDLIASYGVTAVQITDHATTITDYHAVIADLGPAIALRKTQTEVLEELLDSIIGILTDKLDELIVVFQATSPLFVSDYKNARIIVDLGVGQNTCRGKWMQAR